MLRAREFLLALLRANHDNNVLPLKGLPAEKNGNPTPGCGCGSRRRRRLMFIRFLNLI
jgi:hypothetical protein